MKKLKPCVDDISHIYGEAADTLLTDDGKKLLWYYEMEKYLKNNKYWLIQQKEKLEKSIESVDEQLINLDEECKEFIKSIIPDEGYSSMDDREDD